MSKLWLLLAMVALLVVTVPLGCSTSGTGSLEAIAIDVESCQGDVMLKIDGVAASVLYYLTPKPEVLDQLAQERLGVPKIGGVGALSEPVINWLEEHDPYLSLAIPSCNICVTHINQPQRREG